MAALLQDSWTHRPLIVLCRTLPLEQSNGHPSRLEPSRGRLSGSVQFRLHLPVLFQVERYGEWICEWCHFFQKVFKFPAQIFTSIIQLRHLDPYGLQILRSGGGPSQLWKLLPWTSYLIIVWTIIIYRMWHLLIPGRFARETNATVKFHWRDLQQYSRSRTSSQPQKYRQYLLTKSIRSLHALIQNMGRLPFQQLS